jgi:hypothetical protein
MVSQAATDVDGFPGRDRDADESGLIGRSGILIGYARCSTERQDLAAQRLTLRQVGVGDDRVYLDHGLTGTNRCRPGLEQALVALRPVTPWWFPSSTPANART